jgi:hypothetical protein
MELPNPRMKRPAQNTADGWLAHVNSKTDALARLAKLTSVAGGKGVDEATNNHEQAASNDTGLTSPSVDNGRAGLKR